MLEIRFKAGDVIEFYWEPEKSIHRGIVRGLKEEDGEYVVDWENNNGPGFYNEESKKFVGVGSLVGVTAKIVGNIFERDSIHELIDYDS
jgi:hypothetical protein